MIKQLLIMAAVSLVVVYLTNNVEALQKVTGQRNKYYP